MASFGQRFLTQGKVCANNVLRSPLLSAALPSCTQVANLRSKNNPFPLPPRKKPFTHRYNIFWQLLDSPIPRMNENSIVVVVEGNIGTGKKELAKKLAEEFDLKYIDPIDYDQLYIDKNRMPGFDYRVINSCSPERVLFNSLDTFWATEKVQENPLIMMSQFEMFHLRWHSYLNALVHICNTGQGVVMPRNVYSDIVFCYAMMKKKLFPRRVYKEFENYVDNAMKHLWAPHLVIYLDATPAYCLKKIKDRNMSYEVNSPILKDEDFLSYISEGYDKMLLPQLEEESEVLVLDADNLPDFDLLVEELEQFNFNPFRDSLLRDEKFKQWRHTHERSWMSFRLWADSTAVDVHACPHPATMLQIPDIQLKEEETFVICDYLARMKQYYYNVQPGEGGVAGAVKRLFV